MLVTISSSTLLFPITLEGKEFVAFTVSSTNQIPILEVIDASGNFFQVSSDISAGSLTPSGTYFLLIENEFVTINTIGAIDKSPRVFNSNTPASGGSVTSVPPAKVSDNPIPLGQANSLFLLSNLAVAVTTTPGNITIPAATLVGGYLYDSAAQTAAFTLTTDTAANILAAMPDAAVGTSFVFRILNSSPSPYAGTLVPGFGVTLNPQIYNGTISQYQYVDYLFTFTAVGSNPALTVSRVGSGYT